MENGNIIQDTVSKGICEEPVEFLFTQDNLPNIVEAAKIYVLMPKNVPISRAARLQWLLDRINTVITVNPCSDLYVSNDLKIISALPHEGCNINTTNYIIASNTKVKFLAQSYRFVYCLDMSPSLTAINVRLGEILFDEIITNFKTSLWRLCEQFTIPGSQQIFQPCVYLTVIVNTPFFISPAQQVLVKGVQVSSQNVQDIIYSVQAQFQYIEGRIAYMSSLAYDQITLQMQEIEEVGNLFDVTEPECISNIPVVSADANFVNMLRYSMLAISLLPENSLSHIIIITDGVVAMPDSNIMESILFQLHYDSIALSFLKVGSSFNPHVGAGYVSYSDLLHFLSHSTLGTCLDVIPPKQPLSVSMNTYQELFFLWSFDSVSQYNPQSFISHGGFCSVPPLLCKKQIEDDVNVSFILLLYRRMREGYSVNKIILNNGHLEIRLSLHWKTHIFIQYIITVEWPIVKSTVHYEIHVTAPYDFLHDITCLMKKETKSSYRHAVFERCWIRLIQLASNDVAEQLSLFYSSSNWYCIPDSIQSGIPLFILNENTMYDSTKSFLPNDKSCPKFSSMWQPICQIEISNWRKWFHVHKLSLILRHDDPLPKHIHLTNSSGRFDVIQCRQAATALYDFLSKWSTFILIDNHTYVKLLDSDCDTPSFCLIRVTSKFPSATLNIAFITGTSGHIRSNVLDELKQELSSLLHFSLSCKSQETTCTLLQKPLEKICIRYERMPSDFHTVIFPDGTQPPHSLQDLPGSPFAGALFTTLSRYLFHQRWIWCASHPSNSKLEFSVISRILTTLTKMRLKEGFHFAHSASGIITMVLELKMNPVLSCVVQYVLFPPHNEDIHSSSEDDQEYDTDTELQIVTEIWIEPQYGTISTNQMPYLRYMENKYYYELSEEIRQSDLNCINSLLTLEYLSLMCQHKKNLVIDNTHIILNRRQNCTNKNEMSSNAPCNEDSASVWIPILVQRIQHIAYYFNPISILTHCQQTELLFSMFIEGYGDYRMDTDKSNNLLLTIIHNDFLSLHDQELEISSQNCIQFMEQLLLRHKNKSHDCPLSVLNFKENISSECTIVRWRCFLKVVSMTHVILTFLPATLQDIHNLNYNSMTNINLISQQSEPGLDNIEQSLLLPTYVFNCPLKMLIDSCVNIHDMDTSCEKDIFEDHRFKFRENVDKEEISLNTEDLNRTEDRNDSGYKNCAKHHCNTLVLTHYKCFATSIYLALHKDLYVHSLDVQAAMDHCDETVYEIDITEYLQTVCGHLKQHDEVQLSFLNEPKVCNNLKQLHTLIREKFFEITNVAFSAIPTNKEFYYCHTESKLSDGSDEISNTTSDTVDLKSDCNISPIQLNRQSSTNMKQISPLFLHYVCTVRYNNKIAHVSVMVLPTCLGELLQSLHNSMDIQDINKSNIQITLDILCLTLPLNVQNIISGYANTALRTTSMCSDGYQRSISDSTEMSYNLDFKDEFTIQIPENQRCALNKLFDEIKWLLKDEIATSLLDIEPVTMKSLKFVMEHISESILRPSCMLEVIDLNFVHKFCYEKFVKDFGKITIPNYNLSRVDDLYYLSKFEENQYVDEDRKSDDNIQLNISNDDGKNETLNKSDLSSSNTSILGIEDVSEEEINQDSDYYWLLEIHNKRQNLPNFWLVMEIQHEVVKIFFHCRFLELKTNYVNKYIQVQKSICDAVRNLCKHVNQYLLLQSLHNTRRCHSLLEPDDNGDWQGESSTANISNSASYQLRSTDEINDDSDQYRSDLIETSLFKFKPGYFSCPVVWQTHFLLHPRLKTGPGKSSLSTGISALKSVLDKFSVSNRNNMFVYQDKNLNVFYLRTHEHFNYSSGRKSNEFENVSRSPSVVSLPIVQQKSSLPSSDNILTDFRPHVRSFGEKDAKEEQQEDTIVLKVHGITYPEKDVKCELTEVLQNRLDDAVLDILSIMLARNSMCPLTPEDTHFLQKPFSSPEHIIKVSIQNYAINLLDSFIYYLRQNLLQFLNIPKYTDTRQHYHFKDYTDCDQANNKEMDDNIFIYNQSQSPSTGNRGIACISLAIVDNLKDFSFTTNIEELFLNKTCAEIVESRILQDELPDIYLEFRLWNQGRVHIENLSQKLCSAACQANWDIIMEYYLLITPLCTRRESIKTEQFYDHKLLSNHVPIKASVGVNEVHKQVVLDSTTEKSNIKHRIVNYDLKVDRMHLNKKYKTIPQKVPIKERKLNNPKPSIKVDSFESGEEGVLSAIYSKSLQYWLNFAVNLKVPSVKSHTILLRNHHPLNTTVKELQTLITQLSQDGVKTYTPDIIDDVHVPFNTSSFATTCILIARNFEHWKLCIDENSFFEYHEHLYPNVLKHTQKFEPMIVNDGKCIPRQKILWAVINSCEIILYIYNWSKDNMDKLIKHVENLGLWLTIRRCLLSSMTAQKLGLFYDQVINRESLLINNPYLCSIGDVDCMLKFSKDRIRRNIPGGVRDFLITLIESFKDSYKIMSPYTDPIGTFMWEMYEIKQSDKKYKDDLKKMSSMYKSKSSVVTFAQMQAIMQYSRTIHYCHTPLLFLPRWRLEAARTRDNTIVTAKENGASNSSLSDSSTKIDESWHHQLCIHFISEYIYYLKTLGFMSLQVENVEKKLGASSEKQMENIYFMQKSILGGILIFTIELKEPFLITKLHAIEYNRLKTNITYSAVNQIMQSFLDECDKIKVLMHLHSFTYDFHLRCIRNYISGNNNKLKHEYYVTQFLDDFMKYYSKAPNYARNLVYTDTVIISNLSTEGKQLYNYLLSHIKQYNFNVFTMCDDSALNETEYILVQISNTEVSYSDSQDRQLKDDFHRTLIVTNISSQNECMPNSLHLKYYLILTSKSKEIYPKNDIERKHGQFKTVLSLRKIVLPDESAKDKEVKLTTQGDLYIDVGLEGSLERENEDSYDLSDDKQENIFDKRKALLVRPNVEIKQESVNYLGYYSSHEQLMQQFMLDCAKATQKSLTDMTVQGTNHCRTHLLWSKLLSNQESLQLRYSEFTELKSFAKLENLCHVHPNLELLLNQPFSWYQNLAKLLPVKYADQHRLFVSPDGNIQYYIVLHPRYVGAFMMLALDLHTFRGDLYAVYRVSRYIEDTDLCIRERKALMDGFINFVCFFIWSDMI